MTSYHLIDPELRSMVDNFPALVWTSETLGDARAFMEQMIAATPLPDVPVDAIEVSLPRLREAGNVSAILYRPRGVTEALPVLLNVHGGGYVAGSARWAAGRNLQLVDDLRCLVLSVEYRLAPEAPYPAGLEDCYSALRWLHAEAASLGLDVDHIVIAGDSAGGGMAAALALLARDRGEVSVAAQMLTYPMLDDRTSSSVDAGPFAGEYMWDAASNRFGWESYLGRKPGGEVDFHAAPARAEDLSGLPPTFIAVGQLDLFVAENLDYARRLIEAGVPTELHVYPGAFHGFDMVADSASARAYHGAFNGALCRAFAR